ncbi:hypothetical protein K492DRAFT_194455 [Lichtheimia hyalospora FSU 10163]|nr:hypothetical protein K492DRAFT_194455 [Lichtheimia hyalospora FSU 10163]
MVQMQEQSMSCRRSTIHHSSKPLSALASQLHSESDRTHYTKVISMAENLQRRIQDLQRRDGDTCSAISNAPKPPRKELPDDDSQELERYYQLLERSKSLQRTIARISSEFDEHVVNKPVPPTPGSNHHQRYYPSSTTAPLHHHHHPPPPLHPPPSFPLPPTPSTSPSPVDGNNSHHHYHPIDTTVKRLPSIPTRNSESPPSTPQKYPQQLLTSTAAVQQEQPITPPDSPHKQVQFTHNNQQQHNHIDAPLPPPPPVIRIKHVQKRINGFRGFLTRTYQLSGSIVMSRALTTPLRLFTATELITGEPKAILRVILTAPLHDVTLSDSDAPYGFSFYWPGGPKQPAIKPNRAFDMEQFGNVPDHLVQEALERWLTRQGIFPPLHQATHILRENIKIYIVYNRSLFHHLPL